MTGSIKLADYPGDILRLAFEKCGRKGKYRKQSLIAQYGGDIALPDLREEIANCERRGQMHDMYGGALFGAEAWRYGFRGALDANGR